MDFDFKIKCDELYAMRLIPDLQDMGFKKIKERDGPYQISAEYGKEFSSCGNMIQNEMIPLLKKISDSKYGKGVSEIYVSNTFNRMIWTPEHQLLTWSVDIILDTVDEDGGYGQEIHKSFSYKVGTDGKITVR